MEIPTLNIFIPGDTIHTNIAAAVNGASAAPGAIVWIPASYTGGDAVPVSPAVPVFDFRSGNVFIGAAFTGFSGQINKFNGNTLVSHGLASQVATFDATAQAAAISAQQLYAVPASRAGFFRVTWTAKITQAASSSSVLGGSGSFQVGYTAQDDGVALTTTATPFTGNGNNNTATVGSGDTIVYAQAGSNLTFSFGYTSSGVTPMQYAIHVRVEDM